MKEASPAENEQLINANHSNRFGSNANLIGMAICMAVWFSGTFGVTGLKGLSLISDNLAVPLVFGAIILGAVVWKLVEKSLARLDNFQKNQNVRKKALSLIIISGLPILFLSIMGMHYSAVTGSQEATTALLAPFCLTSAGAIFAIGLLGCAAIVLYYSRGESQGPTLPMTTDGSTASALDAGTTSAQQGNFQPTPSPGSVPLPVAYRSGEEPTPPAYAAPAAKQPQQFGQQISTPGAPPAYSASTAATSPPHTSTPYTPNFQYNGITASGPHGGNVPPPAYGSDD